MFIKRDIRLASDDVKANPTLCNAVAAPLAEVGNSIDSGALGKLKSGDASSITAGRRAAFGGIESKTGNAGVPITEDPNPPSAESQQPQWPGPGHHLIRGAALVDDGEQLDP